MKKTASKPIGIFDSGLGGLTVLQEIRKLLPGEDLIYFGDSGRAPYGTKSTETVRKCTESDIKLLLSKDVKAIVAACNTAAACSGREFLESFGVPVVDVIRAGSEEAARVSKTGRIGVIGTPATIKSGIYERSIKALRSDCVFTGRACPLFVPLVEEGWWDNEITAAVCHKYLSGIGDIDTLVLGCTHYPYLEKVIARELGEGVTLVNSAKAVAAQLKNLLEDSGISGKKRGGKAAYYTSDSAEKFAGLAEMFLGKLDGPVLRVDPEDFMGKQ